MGLRNRYQDKVSGSEEVCRDLSVLMPMLSAYRWRICLLHFAIVRTKPDIYRQCVRNTFYHLKKMVFLTEDLVEVYQACCQNRGHDA